MHRLCRGSDSSEGAASVIRAGTPIAKTGEQASKALRRAIQKKSGALSAVTFTYRCVRRKTRAHLRNNMPEIRHQDLQRLRECPPPVVSFFDRDQLIEQYLPYSRALAVDVMCELNSPAQIELNDLVGYGELGLVEAAERFDPSRGVAFTTFAYYRIRGAIYDGLRRMGWLSRGEYRRARFAAAANNLRQATVDDEASAASTNLDKEIADAQVMIGALIPVYLLSLDSTEDLPELADHTALQSAVLEDVELKLLTRTLLSELSADDQSLLEQIYYKNLSMVDVAAKIGASKSWVSRLHARAIKRLQVVMEKHGVLEASGVMRVVG